MAQLAELKREEDAQLAGALSVRKAALARLGRLEGRREGIVREMRAFEEGDGLKDGGEEEEGGDVVTLEDGGRHEGYDGREPGHDGGASQGRGTGRGGGASMMEDGDWGDQGQQAEGRTLARELRSLKRERDAVAREMAAVEARLGALRRRHRWLDGRVEEVRSRREAGLSGYRGALREVEGRIVGLLSRPGVSPLDGVQFLERHAGEKGAAAAGGAEFLRLRPERRTTHMAREWWEGEVALLERRKAEVDRDRAALEEGVEVWNGTVQLVSEFEAALRREMRGEQGDAKGKRREGEPAEPPQPVSPETAMYAQLDKMATVIAGLQERLRIAEDRGWNLLICAIGAELEAFWQAEAMLREALRVAGVEPDEEDGGGDSTPQLGRSASLRDSRQRLDESTAGAGLDKGVNLVDLREEEPGEPESDNEVPPDLLVAPEDERGLESPTLSRGDSENEVPIEFLREHENYAGPGVVA
jgi:hypothetical protein